MKNLTDEQKAAYGAKLDELVNKHLDPDSIRDLILLQQVAGPLVAAKAAEVTLGLHPDVTDLEIAELSKLAKGGVPNEQCEECDLRDECWPDQSSDWSRPAKLGRIPAGVAEFVAHLAPVN